MGAVNSQVKFLPVHIRHGDNSVNQSEMYRNKVDFQI